MMPKGNLNAIPPRSKSRRTAFRDKQKPYDKDYKAGDKLRRKARFERTIHRCQLELAASDSDTDSEDDDTATEGEKRAVVKFFWQTLSKPRRPSTWGGMNGVISYIRRRMGSTAPSIAACHRTLVRLAANADDALQRLVEWIDRIVECKGGVVPDHTVQHGGCSKHKRRERRAEAGALASRVYQPSAEIVALTSAHCAALKVKAKALCGE